MVVLPGVKIGNRVVVGAGSVVTRDTGDDVVVVGNPAKVVRRLRGPEDDVGDKVEGEGVSALKKRLEDLEAEMAEVRRKLEMVLEIDGKKI